VSARVPGRVLVAGIGNVFLGDDGFGVEVVRRVDSAWLRDCVDVVDYGIRGVHLAYDLLDGRHSALVLVDALPLEDPPGTVAVLRVDPAAEGEALGVPDAHGMHPQAVLQLLRNLGGSVERVLVIGCRPAVVAARMGLSDVVAAAVDDAVRLVTEVANAEADRYVHPELVEAGTYGGLHDGTDTDRQWHRTGRTEDPG
jgi:hydrogenase maturation protease